MQYNVFFAGVEGAGHHGATTGFLSPLISETVSVPGACVVTSEMPFYDWHVRVKCAATAAVGWESFPSKRRYSESNRLSLLFESWKCFAPAKTANGTRWPSQWPRNSLKEATPCFRCGGDWRSTLLDTFERHLRSDRIDVDVFSRLFPTMRVSRGVERGSFDDSFGPGDSCLAIACQRIHRDVLQLER